MSMETNGTRTVTSGDELHVYEVVSSVAAQIEQDEGRIKDSLVNALEKNQVAFALKILRDWRTRPPRDVVSMYLEAGDDGK